MSKENIRLIKYLGIIFIAVSLSYKLPHDSYSFIQYIIKPIKRGNSVIYLSGIIPLIFIIIGINGIWGLERFAKKSKILLFLIICAVIIPFMNWTIDLTRMGYHLLKNDGINSIDIEESDFAIDSWNNDTIINISLELKDYSTRNNEFRIRVYVPISLSECIGKEFYELENKYMTGGINDTLNIQEEIIINTENTLELNKLLDTTWYWGDVKYELYNDKERIEIIEHGI